MIPASFMNDRVGPICRNVEDAARVLDVDRRLRPEGRAHRVQRRPHARRSRTRASRRPQPASKGLRIGVRARIHGQEAVHEGRRREHRHRRARVAGAAQARRRRSSIRAPAARCSRAASRNTTRTCTRRCSPSSTRRCSRSTTRANRRAITSPLLVDLFFDPRKFPDGPSIRGLGPAPTAGDRKYVLNRYLRERGDANIKSIDDLIAKSNFYQPADRLPGQEGERSTAATRT